ncbi:MAG: penicillin-binding protein 2 [Alphaproteobacteria bacterium]|nr:penicillin-binding protein 2 [Alphaproteobacteria bacterium]
MNTDIDRGKLFGRRVVVVGAMKAALMSTLIGRLYFLQVVEADRYRMLSEKNRISTRLLPPARGMIVDRFGVPMAVNTQNFQLLVVSEQMNDLDNTLDALSNIIPLTDHDRQRIHRDIERHRSFVPVTVRENLSWEDMARIQVNAPDLPGVIIEEGLTRNYPLKELGAHILGYVSSVTEADLNGDPLLESPGFRIGKAGIERIHDLALRGKSGNVWSEVNSVGRVMQEIKREDGQAGAEVKLTLDIRLQQFAATRLGEESAAAVVVDIHSGEVVLMASTPSFDPNAFAKGLTSSEWHDLISNPRSPLTNKVIAGQYAPGSTFKMMVALAAQESGAMTPEQRVFCSGSLALGNMRFHCWKKGGHGSVDMVQAHMHSCDVYFYEVARRTGIDRIAEMARRFGLGTRTGLELPGERTGLMPDREWKRATLHDSWHPGETLVAGIGQGFMLATPLQLAVMTARIANGEFKVMPRLTKALIVDGPQSKEANAVAVSPLTPLGVAKNHLEVVRQGMYSVSNVQGGTAYAARLDFNGMMLCGKTGSAQVRRISVRERETGVKKNDDLPWEQRDNALFVAFAPSDKPRYAIAVVVEHGGSGAKAAAPIGRDIMREVLRLDPTRDPSMTQTSETDVTGDGG